MLRLRPLQKFTLDDYKAGAQNMREIGELDLIRPGELAHIHFQDVPDMLRELLDNTTRLIPGDGILPGSGNRAAVCGKGPLFVERTRPMVGHCAIVAGRSAMSCQRHCVVSE